MVVAVAIAVTVPAGAVKPPKHPVAVSLDADLMWVHEVGDTISYTVTVENTTREAVTATIESTAGDTTVTIEKGGVETYADLFSYTVTESDLAAGVDIVGSVTVTYGGGEVIAETSTEIDPVNPCDFDALAKGVCIWKPTGTGQWTIKFTPDSTRPARVTMTLRDGVPGNWCTLENLTGGAVQERWLPNSPTPIDLQVYVPADGECLLGGHGSCIEEDCFFAVGNPASFYLYTSFSGTAELIP
jgi:hypothetical protein